MKVYNKEIMIAIRKWIIRKIYYYDEFRKRKEKSWLSANISKNRNSQIAGLGEVCNLLFVYTLYMHHYG